MRTERERVTERDIEYYKVVWYGVVCSGIVNICVCVCVCV